MEDFDRPMTPREIEKELVKTGRKQVVDWLMHRRSEIITWAASDKEWQEKLKEWGLE